MAPRSKEQPVRVAVTLSRRVSLGLSLLCDSFEMHMREGLTSGSKADDDAARAAARWIGRLRAKAARIAAHDERRREMARQR